MQKEILIENFIFPVPVTVQEDDCWIPIVAKGKSWSSGGYFVVMFDGEPWSGHRLSRHLNFGDTPRNSRSKKEGICCHHCDNKQCVNPNHSYIGTQSQNIKDWFERNEDGRNNHFRSLIGNKNSVGNISWLGKNHSDESKHIMSQIKLNRPISDEGKAKCTEARIESISGIPRREEDKLKIKMSNKEYWNRRRKMGSVKRSHAKYQNNRHETVILGSGSRDYKSAECFLGVKHKAFIQGEANHG